MEETQILNSRNRGCASNQLCWSCKRATNPEGLRCSWANSGEPVTGWTATKGLDYYNKSNDGKLYYTGSSYNIIECPLYVKDREISTRADCVKMIADTLNVSERSVTTSIKKYIERYERKTGKKVPQWVYKDSE